MVGVLSSMNQRSIHVFLEKVTHHIQALPAIIGSHILVSWNISSLSWFHLLRGTIQTGESASTYIQFLMWSVQSFRLSFYSEIVLGWAYWESSLLLGFYSSLSRRRLWKSAGRRTKNILSPVSTQFSIAKAFLKALFLARLSLRPLSG